MTADQRKINAQLCAMLVKRLGLGELTEEQVIHRLEIERGAGSTK